MRTTKTEEDAKYETPELLELGDVSELTLGAASKPNSDNCGCKRSTFVIS